MCLFEVRASDLLKKPVILLREKRKLRKRPMFSVYNMCNRKRDLFSKYDLEVKRTNFEIEIFLASF